MTEMLEFQQFLVQQSNRDSAELFRRDSVDLPVTDADIQNAFHFMKDVELAHAEIVDDVVDDPEAYNNIAAMRASCVNNADDINFVSRELRGGNPAIILALSALEKRHVKDYGTRPYSPDDPFWDGDTKWSAFVGLMDPKVPDAVPEDFRAA